MVGLGIGGLRRVRPPRLRRDPHDRTRCWPCGCFRHRLFRATNIVMAFGMASFIGLTFVLPLYLQGLRGLDPLRQRPDDVPPGHRHPHLVADRRADLRPRRPAAPDHRRHARGRRVDGVAAARRSGHRPVVDPRGDLRPGLRHGLHVRGSVQTASYAQIPPADNGRASAIFSTQRQMSVSIGIALMATVLTSFTTLSAAPERSAAGADGLPLDVRAGGRAGPHGGVAGVPDASATRTPPPPCSPATDRAAQSGWSRPVTSIDIWRRPSDQSNTRCVPAGIGAVRRRAARRAGAAPPPARRRRPGVSPRTLTAVPSAKRTRLVRCSGTALDAAHRHPAVDERAQVDLEQHAVSAACSASMRGEAAGEVGEVGGIDRRARRAAPAAGAAPRRRTTPRVPAAASAEHEIRTSTGHLPIVVLGGPTRRPSSTRRFEAVTTRGRGRTSAPRPRRWRRRRRPRGRRTARTRGA